MYHEFYSNPIKISQSLTVGRVSTPQELEEPSKHCTHISLHRSYEHNASIQFNVTSFRLLRAPACLVCTSTPLVRYVLTSIHSQRKQTERTTRIASLPSAYLTPISPNDRFVLEKPIEDLVRDVHSGGLKPIDILQTYGKIAIRAHEKTNCLTEVMLPEAEEWAEHEVNLEGPLAGVPISLKDSIAVKDFDVSVGYSCNTGKPYAQDGTMVRILKDAGQLIVGISSTTS